jgi:hypothetical protein
MVVTGVLIFALGLGGWYIVRHVLDVASAQSAVIEHNSNRLTALETLARQNMTTGATTK